MQAGTSTTVNIAMSLGTTHEVVTVEAATAQINYDSHTVAGVVTRENVEDLPLNGRNMLQLATLEPGVTSTPASVGVFNSQYNLSILGGSRSYVTVDGGSIVDNVESGTVGMNLSNEVVQEFQTSTVNNELGTGITSTGSINIVTRSGGNDFHGSGYFFYRDHNMAAYPGLARSTLDPNPFFARRNPGAWIGGPILKNKLFFFFNYEYTNQVQAIQVQPDLPSFGDWKTSLAVLTHRRALRRGSIIISRTSIISSCATRTMAITDLVPRVPAPPSRPCGPMRSIGRIKAF